MQETKALISAMTGESRGCSRAAAPVCGFSRGTTARSVSLPRGARAVGPPCAWRRGSASLLPSHGRGIWPRDVLKEVSRGLSRVEAGNPGFPRLVQVTSGGFSWWLREARETGGGRGLSGLHWAWRIGRGPHLQLRQEPQGTSDFRLRSQGPCRLGTGESGPVESWSSACLSRCPRGERPLVELYLEPGVFSDRSTEKLPLRVDFIHRVEFGEVSGHRVLIKRGPGNRGPTECGTTHEATSGMSS